MNSEPTKAQREHILIVEGDRELSKSLTTLLNASGYQEVRAVRSTSRALAVAATFQPAIAFLGTPAPDGIEKELATLLHKNSRSHGIRLIGLTDLAEHPTREEARSSGIERYLSRSVTQIELDKALRKAPAPGG
jgi:PleD family two-component response regulator